MSQISKKKTNAFEQLFSSAQEPEASVNMSTSKHVNKSTVQHVNSLTPQIDTKLEEEKSVKITKKKETPKPQNPSVNMSTVKKNQRILRGGKNTQAKTFFLESEILEMFKFIKFKQKMDESEYANLALTKIFIQEFGENWKKLIK